MGLQIELSSGRTRHQRQVSTLPHQSRPRQIPRADLLLMILLLLLILLLNCIRPTKIHLSIQPSLLSHDTKLLLLLLLLNLVHPRQRRRPLQALLELVTSNGVDILGLLRLLLLQLLRLRERDVGKRRGRDLRRLREGRRRWDGWVCGRN